MSNLDSLTELTEFEPLTSQKKRTSVTSIFSKIFSLSKENEKEETQNRDRDDESNSDFVMVNETGSLTASSSQSSIVDNFIPTGFEPRNFPSVLRRVKKLLVNNKNSVAYKDTKLKQYWMPDSVSKECYDCGEKFNTFRRRHHCRVCGQIFCSKCCNQEVPGKLVGCSGDLRVCTFCSKVMLPYLHSSDMEAELSADLKAIQEDEAQSDKIGNILELPPHEKRKISVGYQEELFSSTRNMKKATNNMDNANVSSISDLLEEITNEDSGLQFHPEGENNFCFYGYQLIDWLIACNKTSSRIHSLAICQVLLDANYIEHVSENSNNNNYVDGRVIYSLKTPVIVTKKRSPGMSSTILEYERNFTNTDGSSGSTRSVFQVDLNLQKSTAQISRYSTEKRKPKTNSKDDAAAYYAMLERTIEEYCNRGIVYPFNWNDAKIDNQLTDEDNTKSTFLALSDAFTQHILNTTKQLLSNECLSLSWMDIILPLTYQAVEGTKPENMANESIDIRHYVKLKKVPGGDRKDCCLIRGIVLTKNVAHKGMKTCLGNPKILLIKCAIMYQRIQGKLISLEPVLLQEKEYLRNVIARIGSLKPDIIFVHKNVSRLAQESLMRLGISLVLKVKLTVMERIARCTEADILTSIDAQVGNPRLGKCSYFYTTDYTLDNGDTKTLMVLGGCVMEELGCTILLTGTCENELIKLKRVVNTTLLMVYNSRKEKAFLLDEYAKPPKTSSMSFLADSPDSETKSTNDNELKLPIKKVEEERRLISESVSDHSDPLNANLFKEKEDEIILSEVPLSNQFRSALEETILSISPFITLNIPYLTTESGRQCELRKYFQQDLYGQLEDETSTTTRNNEHTVIKKARVTSHNINDTHELVTSKLKDNCKDERIQTLLAFYRAKGSRYNIIINNNKREPIKRIITDKQEGKKQELLIENDKHVFRFDNHQHISILFCRFSPYSNNAPQFCFNPCMINMDFYGSNDISLCGYLKRYCFRYSYACPSVNCDTPMMDHERRFVHDTGCISVNTYNIKKKFDNPILSPHNIFTWSCCKYCKLNTPITALSEDGGNLSFGKYLELLFHGVKYTCRSMKENECQHTIHQSYCHYFLYQNIVASFKYSNISLWEISMPSIILKLQPFVLQLNELLDEMKKWSLSGHEVFSAVLEKLCTFETDDNTAVGNIQAMKRHLTKQQSNFKCKVDEIQMTLTDSKEDWSQKDHIKLHDSMVALKKSVAQIYMEWNALLVKFDLKSKKDIKNNKTIEIMDATTDSSDDTNKSDKLIYENELEITDEEEDKTSEQDTCNVSDDNKQSIIINDEIQHVGNSSQSNDKISVKSLLSQLLPNMSQHAASAALLSNPMSLEEHYVVNVTSKIPIIIYEDEPSSIIAYALSTYRYHHLLDAIEKNKLSKKDSQENSKEYSSTLDLDDQTKFEATEEVKTRPIRNDAQHIELQFSDTTTIFKVTIYFAEGFARLRNLVFPSGEEMYVRSLSRSIQWAAHGGKSGSTFSKTKDDRFISKEVSRLEMQQLLDFSPHYFDYIQSNYNTQRPTLLGKIVGVYRVRYKNSSSNMTFSSNLLIMENLFYTRSIVRKFDLKGSLRNRLVNPDSTHEEDLVLLDENFINMTCDNPLYIHPHSKTVLMNAINSDVTFLSSKSVMDYSLLVGFDETKQELVLGIIDYIRTFTWDKKLETIVKKSGILGGQGKLPTIVSPEEYKDRFTAAMHKYFLAVPNRWTGFSKEIIY